MLNSNEIERLNAREILKEIKELKNELKKQEKHDLILNLNSKALKNDLKTKINTIEDKILNVNY